ncbi:MAG TPA: nucleoside hydrolase, partial [Flavisolibacter sp.]|nr:nucleoside hydrolase [Flavisolibacter sp.]
LSAQPDHSVVIITTGFFTNIANLLRSGADLYSSLNGGQLIQQKVKMMISMAGGFPSGYEFNIHKDAASARYVLSTLKIPVIYSGFEIGRKIKVGLPLIHDTTITGSPVQDAFRIAIPQAREDSAGRMSWDETAVLVTAHGWEPFYTLHKGCIVVEEDGHNSWNDAAGLQAYLVEKADPSDVRSVIEQGIRHRPMNN